MKRLRKVVDEIDDEMLRLKTSEAFWRKFAHVCLNPNCRDFLPELSTVEPNKVSFVIEGTRFEFSDGTTDYVFEGKFNLWVMNYDTDKRYAYRMFRDGSIYLCDDWTPSDRLVAFTKMLIENKFFEK